MSIDRDVDTARIVRSWLRTEEHESADRVLDDVFALLDATPQRRSWWPARRFADMTSSDRGPQEAPASDPVAEQSQPPLRRVSTAISAGSAGRPVPLGFVRLVVAAAAVLAIAVVGMNLRGSAGPFAPSGTVAPTSTPVASPTPTVSIVEDEFGPLQAGEHDLGWPGGPADARVRVTISADDWSWMGPGHSMIYKDHGRLFGFPADVEVHSVSQVVTSVCALDEASDEVGPIFVDVGPTVDDLAAAIRSIAGTSWSEPVDITIGGHRGKRLETTYLASCDGPGRRTIWEERSGYFFVEVGMRSTVDILDVDGDRLVITQNVRTSDPAIVQQLDDIVSSMAIVRDQAPIDQPILIENASGRPFPRAIGPDADLRTGRHRAVVEGIAFTFVVPEPGWETQRGFYLVKSITGPQGAEGTIRWTTIPNGEYTDPCPAVLDDAPGQSLAELAAAIAAAPGVLVLDGPIDATVGGRRAAYVRLEVERDLGCDPAYFYTYEPLDGGALWLSTKAGDLISVWIVEVDGRILFIETEAMASAQPILDGSFRSIVDSMSFE
jgi:hypothetical protein